MTKGTDNMTKGEKWECYQATPAATLEEHIMDSRHAKSEAEWWASREIESLRQQVRELSELLDCVKSERDEQLAEQKHLTGLVYRAADPLKQQLAESQAREKVLRDALERLAKLGNGDVFGNSEGNTIAFAAYTLPSDSTALDSAISQTEERVEASYKVELDLLREIGEILEPIEYLGSYAEGVKAAIKQAKRKVLDYFVGAGAISQDGDIYRRMVEGMK